MSDKQELLAANEAFYRAFEKQDIEAMSEVWSKGTASFCIHPGRNALQGWDEIRASWAKIFKNADYMEIETKIMSAETSDNLGYVVLTEKLFQVVRGRRIVAQTMATNVFEFMGGKYYLIHHHGSPIMR